MANQQKTLGSSMDWTLKPCTLWDHHNLGYDRLTSLPNELLIHILSLLPTKEVAATCVLNKRLIHVFPFITSLDFDASPISLCVKQPYAVQRYPIFVAFVNTVLQAHRSRNLSRFRLQLGSSCYRSLIAGCYQRSGDELRCLPDLKSTQLSTWLSFPLNFCSLRELDLRILLKEPSDAQLPPAIFTCQTLQVLKLEVNIGLDQVLSIPTYHLPNLRFLTLCASFISDDSFLPRLLACCPLVEDLTYDVLTNHVSHVTIHSASLRRLCLRMFKIDECEYDNTDVVLIHTPYLEYLDYTDNLAFYYSIPTMHCLVKAKLSIWHIIETIEDSEVLFELLINLITSVSYVQRLTLVGLFLREFHYVDVKYLKDKLPMFPNLRYLKLGDSTGWYLWNKFLLHLLDCSPVLEILVFPEGVLHGYNPDYDGENYKSESEFLGSVHPVPSCCRHHLKRIVIKQYLGIPLEEEFVQFFLRHALVLEELIIYLNQGPLNGHPIPDQMSIEESLMNLPKASVTCSIQVLWSP